MKGWVKALLPAFSVLIASQAIAGVGKNIFELTNSGSFAELVGELTQGSLLRGRVPAGSEVCFNEQALAVTPDGQFVFGIGRDAPLQHELTIRHPDGTDSIALQFSARSYDIQHVEGVAQRYVTPPPEVLDRIRQDSAAVRQARNVQSELSYVFTQPVWPAYGRISGVYGSQRIFNGVPRNPHYGLDIAGPTGSPVYAPWSGVVTLAKDLYYSGLTLIVDHGYGVSSTLMHLDAFHVNVGDKIEQGQLVADMGASGRVTGPHLDWRINWYQERLDPALLMPEAAPPKHQP